MGPKPVGSGRVPVNSGLVAALSKSNILRIVSGSYSYIEENRKIICLIILMNHVSKRKIFFESKFF